MIDNTYIVAILGIFITIMLWIMSDIRSQVRHIDEDVRNQGIRIDAISSEINRLYRMFVDLVTENKKERRERKVKK